MNAPTDSALPVSGADAAVAGVGAAETERAAGGNDSGAIVGGDGNGGIIAGGRPAPVRVPVRRRLPRRRWSSMPVFLLGIFLLINVTGGLLLYLPAATVAPGSAGLKVAFFTAISAATVTGLTQVDTQTAWTFYGQAVLFFLMLVGGLEFIIGATVLVFLARRTTPIEEDIYRDTFGSGASASVARVARNIVIAFMGGYLFGAALLFFEVRRIADFTLPEAIWQSLFLSVSALNNAGLSILPNSPEGNNFTTLGAYPYLMAIITPMIIMGALGWTLTVDLRRHWSPGLGRRRWWGLFPFNFARLSLDTKLALIMTAWLYAFSIGALLFFEWGGILSENSLLGKLGVATFHGVSGRTAGFAALNWEETREVTHLVFSGLMFVGGSTASVAGGIKVNTLAVLLAAARSATLRHPRTEVFRREIGAALVARALLVLVLAVSFLFVTILVLTYTDPHLDFVPLLFETVSAFGTNGMSVGVSGQLSLAGSIVFMVAMLVGRVGPLTLILLLVARDDAPYRYPEEPVRIG